MQGAFNKLSIVFHPLGFNHFIDSALSHYAQDHFSFFNAFGPDFEQLLEAVFEASDMGGKRDLLDEFFLSRLSGFSESRLSYALERILATSGQVPVGQLASELDISRKTLFRMFKQHLAYAPSEYRSIVKFRKVLNAYQDSKKKPNLSSLAYAASYYDQSDLNFHFRSKTGQTPAQLFAGLKTVEPGLYWKLADVPKVQDKGSTEE
jgi:AraC-like DNA-binding protein